MNFYIKHYNTLLFLYIPYIESIPLQLNMTFHEHRQLLPFVPDRGGNKNCNRAGDQTCGQHGACIANQGSITNWTCSCNEGWFTKSSGVNSTCSTKRPSQAIAIFLQIFLGWISIGALYLGWTIYGSIQFIIIAVVCISCCIVQPCKSTEFISSSRLSKYMNDNNTDTSPITALYGCLIGLGITIMWIYNLILIINNCHNSEGIPCDAM